MKLTTISVNEKKKNFFEEIAKENVCVYLGKTMFKILGGWGREA